MSFESPSPRLGRPFVGRWAVLALLLILSIWGCRPPGSSNGASSGESSAVAAADEEEASEAGTKEELAARRVEVETVRRGPVRETITLSTTLEARLTVEIPARVAGRVAEALVRPGARVAENEPLLRIESREFELAFEEQELAHQDAVERAATAELDWQDAGTTEQLRELATEKAKKEFERLDGLATEEGRKAVSDEAVEQARFTWEESRITQTSARLATRRAEHARRLAQIAVERARVARDRAQLDLSRAVIRAPLSGAVTWLDVRSGEQVVAGAHVATVVDPSELFCTIRVPQRRLGDLEIGQRVEIEAETHPGEVFQGAIEAIIPVVDPVEGTIEARVRVPDPNGDLRPGAFLSARVVLSERPDAVLVPKRARLFEGSGSYVFVVRDDRAVKVPIETGLLTTDQVEILPAKGALESVGVGEAVVIRGQSRLRDGERVKTSDDEPPPDRTSPADLPAEDPRADRRSETDANSAEADSPEEKSSSSRKGSSPDETGRG